MQYLAMIYDEVGIHNSCSSSLISEHSSLKPALKLTVYYILGDIEPEAWGSSSEGFAIY